MKTHSFIGLLAAAAVAFLAGTWFGAEQEIAVMDIISGSQSADMHEVMEHKEGGLMEKVDGVMEKVEDAMEKMEDDDHDDHDDDDHDDDKMMEEGHGDAMMEKEEGTEA